MSNLDKLSILEKKSALQILLYLKECTSSNIEQMKKETEMGKTSIASATDLLEKGGLIQVNQKYKYGEKIITITALGKKVASKIEEILILLE